MIYRVPGFIAVELELLELAPPPPSPVSKLDRRNTGRLRKKDKLLTGEGGVGEEPNHHTRRENLGAA